MCTDIDIANQCSDNVHVPGLIPILTMNFFSTQTYLTNLTHKQGWAQGSFVEAEAERSRQRRGKAAMSLTEARQGIGRELEAEARQTKFEARPRRGDP